MPESEFLSSFAFLKHVLYRGLVDHQVRPAIVADHFDTSLVVPLDRTMHFLAVLQHDYHRRLRLHLLLVIKVFGIRLLRRRCLSSAPSATRAVASITPVKSTLWPVVPVVSIPALRHLHMIGVVIGIVVSVVVIRARQRRTDQFAVGEILVVSRLLGQCRIDGFLHSGATLAHASPRLII